MSRHLRIIARIAIFSSLVFIFSYFSAFLYNVNFGFFIIFSAAFVWGLGPGIGVALIGLFLWSNFNPFGPALLPVLISQLVGGSLIAIIGLTSTWFIIPDMAVKRNLFLMILFGLLSGLFYHLPVDIVDALVYQPFWPRLIGGAIFSLITIISCGIIFPIFYPALVFMYKKEKNKSNENRFKAI